MRSEYKFDYSKAKKNRFATRMTRPVIAVVLDADVAGIFDSSEKVNDQLRASLAPKKRARPSTRPFRRKAG